MTVPPGDPDALAEALTRVLDHEEEAAAMGARSLRRAETTFSFATFLSETLKVFNDAVKARRVILKAVIGGITLAARMSLSGNACQSRALHP